MSLKKCWLIILALLLLASCKQEVDLETPPEIIYGEDVCAACGMIINETRYAAAYVTISGDAYRFDDIGGMLKYDLEANDAVHIYWAHDFNTEEWINAENATFVLDNNLTTPMGWGVAAFGAMADAEAYAAEHGGVIATYAVLQEEIKTGKLDPTALDMHDHEEHEEMDMGQE